jgi:hypothetical protein
MYYEPLRAEVRRLRIITGKAVEVPDLQKFLIEKHNCKIERGALTHAMRRMGFKFAKANKYQVVRRAGCF